MTLSPNAKVASTGLGGAIGVLVLWGLESSGVTGLTPERSGAIVSLICAVVAWLVSDRKD